VQSRGKQDLRINKPRAAAKPPTTKKGNKDMIGYDEAYKWLHANFCTQYHDYTTECSGCPNAKACYMDLSDVPDVRERTAIFESRIISAVEYFKGE
jgi:hypothetical protein